MHRQVKRWLLLAFGLLCVGLAVLGLFLPVLPTAPFLLVATWAFAQSSQRLHRWLMLHPRFGPLLRQWQEQGAIPLRAKVVAVGSMAATAVWLTTFADLAWWVVAAALAVLGYGAWFVLGRPTAR